MFYLYESGCLFDYTLCVMMSAYMTQKIVLVFSYDYVLEFSKEGDKARHFSVNTTQKVKI